MILASRPTADRRPGVAAPTVFVTVDYVEGRWHWALEHYGATGHRAIVARSIPTFPTEHDARAEGWAMYKLLRATEGDRAKWGSPA